jgi:hypothetical protein
VQGPPTKTADTAAPVALVSYTYNGSTLIQNQSYAVPSSSLANALTLTTLSGQHDGMLRLSGDGNYLTFGGYRALPGSNNPQNSSATSVNRVVGTFNLSTAAINTSQALTDAYNFAPLTTVVTQDASEFWTGGSVGFTGLPATTNFDLSGGVRYVSSPLATTTTNIGMTQTVSGTLQPDSVRSLLIANNNLYITTASQSSYKVLGSDGNTYFRGLYQVGGNIPITHATAPTYTPIMNDLESGTVAGQEVIPDSKGSYAPKSDLVFLDLNPSILGADTAYGTGGKNEYEKWSLVDVGGGQFAWRQTTIWDLSGANGSSGITDINALAAFAQGNGTVDIFATSDGGIYHFTDDNTQTGFVTTSAPIVFLTTLSNTQFRGIAAVPEPATAALLALASLALLRRKRAEV